MAEKFTKLPFAPPQITSATINYCVVHSVQHHLGIFHPLIDRSDMALIQYTLAFPGNIILSYNY